MEWILGIVIGILIIFFVIDKSRSNKEKDNIKVKKNEKLPYKATDSILSNAERSFYHSLKLCVGERAVICPKVGLKDFFFIGKGVGKEYMKYFGKIAKKHVDFLLCEPGTMRPLCGIELDDFSHTSKKGYMRDVFVDKVYKDANFELIRISTKSRYSQSEIEVALTGVFNRRQVMPQENIPHINLVQNNAIPNLVSQNKSVLTDVKSVNNIEVLCPKCGIPMISRKAFRGPNKGKEFFGCVNYPDCKEVVGG
jgi:hypothetical protein